MKSSARCFRIILFYIFCWILITTADEKAADLSPAKTDTSQNVSTKLDRLSASSKILQNPQGKETEKKILQSDTISTVINSDYLVEPSVNVEGTFREKHNEEGVFNSKQIFLEATSQNSGVAANEITSGPPVVVTLTDGATAELQERAIIPPSPSQQADKPSTNQSSDSNLTHPGEPHKQTDSGELVAPPDQGNLTEEIPSFSEWTQKHLEEAEKRKEPLNASTQPSANGGSKPGSGAKLRWKNYASLDCGAKVVASNPEAVSPYAVLSPSRDEYKLNTCTSRIWFIVELCEAIQAKKIDLANFELFSSSPKDFSVSVSDRFPTKEWSNVGHFTAKDERDVQSFDLHPHLFGKYIKVEVKSHYGSEHFCPISLFRVYGTSEFEVLQKEDPVHGDRLEDDDDDDEFLDVDNGDSSKNLFSSATDAVISMVKKAAQVLGNKGRNDSQGVINGPNAIKSKYSPLVNSCTSPSHLVVCDNCTDLLFGQVYQLLSCRSTQIRNLVSIPLIRKALISSTLCRSYGFDFRRIASTSSINSRSLCVESFFPAHYLGAMCNSLAISENKVVLNISNQYSNDTKKVADLKEDFLRMVETSEPSIMATGDVAKEAVTTEALVSSEISSSIETATNSEFTSYQIIRPTKTMSSDELILHESTQSPLVPSVEVLEIEELFHPISDSVSEPQEASESNPDAESHTPLQNTTESVENLDDPLDNIISELNGDSVQKEIHSSTPQVQKESVFLRLSNRIKALERNMSLSGQYLEELSKRYKKQVEEMQKLLDKTVVNMNEEIKKKDERNKVLEDDLRLLKSAVDALTADKNGWTSIIYCIVTSTLVTIFIYKFCLMKSGDYKRAFIGNNNPVVTAQIDVGRRKSIDVVNHSEPKKNKKRRPSDQALKIVRSSMVTSSEEAPMGDGVRKEKTKRKKRRDKLRRSSSINTLNEETFKPPESSTKVWTREDWLDDGHLEDVPFALDESEHSTLEPLNLPSKTNGSPAVEVPAYVNTAMKARKDRESLQEQGFQFKVPARKAVSADESAARLGPVTPPIVINGNSEMNVEGSSTPKKEKRSFKKMFKKVF